MSIISMVLVVVVAFLAGLEGIVQKESLSLKVSLFHLQLLVFS